MNIMIQENESPESKKEEGTKRKDATKKKNRFNLSKR